MEIIVGIALIVLGIYCLIRPEKGILSSKPSFAKRHLSPIAYLRYKRFLGVFMLLVGLFIASVAIMRMIYPGRF